MNSHPLQKIKAAFALWVAGLFIFLPACGPARAATITVSMVNFNFVPADIIINVGDTVEWMDTQGFHDTVSGTEGVPSGTWNSNSQFGRLMRPGEKFSFTFNTPGTFPYYCTPHWACCWMIGTVTVVAPNSPPTVAITNPANNANFAAPASFIFQATASDSDGTVARVEFFINGVLQATDAIAPYQAAVNNLSLGNYSLVAVAVDNLGARSTNSVSISVNGQAPLITSGPVSQVVNEGSDVLFSATASGTQPLQIQWFFNQTEIAGATGSSLVLQSVSTNQAGNYSVVVSNAFGSDSAVATLTVTNAPQGEAPVFLKHPQSQTVEAGSNVLFTTSVSGSAPLFFQWFFNGTPLGTATNSFLSLQNATAPQAGNYFLVASNAFGSGASQTALLTVIEPPACAFSLSATSALFAASGGTGSVSVTTSSGCSWSVVNTNFWISLVTPATATGTATVVFNLVANSGPATRTGNLLIAGKLFAVAQSGTAIPAKNDFNRDGFSDLLWQHTDGRIALWLMDGVAPTNKMLLRGGRKVAAGWQIVGTHDFDGDGFEDILWQHEAGRVAVWFMRGVEFIRGEPIANAPLIGPEWRLSVTGDFSRDSSADFLFRHRDGFLLLWFMKGKVFQSQSLLFGGDPVPPEWHIGGASDINGDRQLDLFWRLPATGDMVVWQMAGQEPSGSLLLTGLPKPKTAWRMVGFGDFNRDNRADILWRNVDDGRAAVWFMNGTNRLSASMINGGKPVSLGWRLVAPR